MKKRPITRMLEKLPVDIQNDGSGGIIFRDDHFIPEKFMNAPIPWLVAKIREVVGGKSVVLMGGLEESLDVDWPVVRCNLHGMGKSKTIIRFKKMHRVGHVLYPDFAPLTGVTAMKLLLMADVDKLLIAGWDFYLGSEEMIKDRVGLHHIWSNVEAFVDMVDDRVILTKKVQEALAVYAKVFEERCR